MAAAGLMLSGCKQDEVGRFDYDHQMLRPVRVSAGLSFRADQHPDGGTIDIAFDVVGRPEDRVRTMEFAIGYIVSDFEGNEVLPFPEDKVEVVSATVPAGATRGTLTLRITPPSTGEVEDVNDFEKYLLVSPVVGGDFHGGPESGIASSLQFRDVQVCLSSKLVAPASWPTLATGNLGVFSSAYYQFIIDATGVSEYPIDEPVEGMNLDSNGTPQKWTDAQKQNFVDQVKAALTAYNNEHPDAHLTHDSGPAKGFEVVVGQVNYQ